MGRRFSIAWLRTSIWGCLTIASISSEMMAEILWHSRFLTFSSKIKRWSILIWASIISPRKHQRSYQQDYSLIRPYTGSISGVTMVSSTQEAFWWSQKELGQFYTQLTLLKWILFQLLAQDSKMPWIVICTGMYVGFVRVGSSKNSS